MRKFLFGLIAVFTLGLVGLATTLRWGKLQTPTDPGCTYAPTRPATITTIDGNRYQYIASPERRQAIVDGYARIRAGQSREEVRRLLGPPDEQRPMYTKSLHPEFIGWVYSYNLQVREGGPNMNNVVVEVFFDDANRVHWAVPSNIPGLHEVGHCERP